VKRVLIKVIFLSLSIFLAPATVMLASCGRSDAFYLRSRVISPDEPVILDAWDPKTAAALSKEKFSWVDDQDHSSNIFARQIYNSQFVMLAPPSREPGHSYRLINTIRLTCADGETKSRGRLCINFKHFPEYHTLSVRAATEPGTPADFQLKAVEITGGVIGLGVNLSLTASRPLTALPLLLVESRHQNDTTSQYHVYNALSWDEKKDHYQLTSGSDSGLNCGLYSLRLWFLETSEIKIYEIRPDGLHRIAGWRVTLPAPLGVSVSRYRKMSERYEQAIRNMQEEYGKYEKAEKTMIAYEAMIDRGGKLPAKTLKIVPLTSEEFPQFTPLEQ
jgi:hypothetical protein